MHLSGETEIAASRQRVWDTVSNPNVAAASGSSGQAQIDKIDDRHYKLTVTTPATMMSVAIVLDLELTDMEAPTRLAATIQGAVMGGPINGTGSIELAEVGPKLTRVSWVADATLGGLLGGFEPMIQGPMQQGADQGFASLKARLEADEAASGS
jgi:carbon monoxide dehydrogenase subunit G